jgi:glutathione S-transferase
MHPELTFCSSLNTRKSSRPSRTSKPVLSSPYNSYSADRNSSVPPNADGTYTLPTIRLPDGTYIMDSFKIADALEARYPEPSLHLNSDMQKRFVPHMVNIMEALYPTHVPLIMSRLLNPPSQAFWEVSRKALIEAGPDPDAWKKADPSIKEVTKLLEENNGPFFAGEVFTYADILWIGFLIFWKRIGDDVYEKFL